MQVSATSLTNKTKGIIRQYLEVVFAELKNTKGAAEFLDDFFTETERTVLTKRLAIAVLLKAGSSYADIKQELSVSSATISTVVEMMQRPGVKQALTSIADDAWAENLVQKLPFFGK